VAPSAEVPSQARSVLVPFSGPGSEIPLSSDPSRALKNALKPLRLRGATRCASRGFNPRPNRRASQDERLASAYYQFLLVSFGGIFDTASWGVYPDKGFFSRDRVVDRVGFLLNRTYKKALGSRTPRIIHRIGAYDSKRIELIQLADVLLAALSYSIIPSPALTSASSLALIVHCATSIEQNPKDRYDRERLAVNHWVLPEKFFHR